jgi:molecular chaperone HtpG
VIEKQKETEKEFDDVLKRLKEALKEQVKEVRVTHRLTDSPACVVFDENAMSGHMQRMMKAAGQNFPEAPPILELNPEHPILLKVKSETDETEFGRWASVLLNQALLAEGEDLKDPAAFVKELNSLLQRI